MQNPLTEIDECLDVYEEGLSRKFRDEIGEENITVLGKATRLRLFLHNPVLMNDRFSKETIQGDDRYYSIGFRCTLHPDFDHTIKHARLTINLLSAGSNAEIKDLFPREIIEPTKYSREIKVTAGVEFNFLKLSGEMSEISEFEYYLPKIKSYGVDSQVAYFDFISGNNEIKLDNMLYMLIKIKKNTGLQAKFNIMATVKIKGNIEIPLVTKKNGILNNYITILDEPKSILNESIKASTDDVPVVLNALDVSMPSNKDTPLMSFNGLNGQINIYHDSIIITRNGSMAKLTQKGKEKTIFLHQIKSVEFKKVNIITNGYIRFTTESTKALKNIFEATRDTNTVMFGLLKQNQAFELQKLVTSLIKNK
jgi:hypothetical protein